MFVSKESHFPVEVIFHRSWFYSNNMCKSALACKGHCNSNGSMQIIIFIQPNGCNLNKTISALMMPSLE